MNNPEELEFVDFPKFQILELKEVTERFGKREHGIYAVWYKKSRKGQTRVALGTFKSIKDSCEQYHAWVIRKKVKKKTKPQLGPESILDPNKPENYKIRINSYDVLGIYFPNKEILENNPYSVLITFWQDNAGEYGAMGTVYTNIYGQVKGEKDSFDVIKKTKIKN